jgi:REP element-mobilizing transposase RayT
VWYEIHTRINNREPLFRHHQALTLFTRVFTETKKRFVFQIRELQIADNGLRFYIKPEDGLQLPAIMKWLKQVFAQRYNRMEDREGHIWGDRYGSRILEGEPPAPRQGGIAGGCGVRYKDVAVVDETRVRPQQGKSPLLPLTPPFFDLLLAPAPG